MTALRMCAIGGFKQARDTLYLKMLFITILERTLIDYVVSLAIAEYQLGNNLIVAHRKCTRLITEHTSYKIAISIGLDTR